MRTGFTLFILIFHLTGIRAQQLDPSLICSAGGSFNNSATNINWTIGETVVVTLHTPNLQLASGFQQFSYSVVSVQNNLSDKNIKLFPNPAQNILTIQTGDTHLRKGNYQLLDISGHIILSGEINSDITNINCSQLSPATYFLKVSSSSDQQLQAFKITKL